MRASAAQTRRSADAQMRRCADALRHAGKHHRRVYGGDVADDARAQQTLSILMRGASATRAACQHRGGRALTTLRLFRDKGATFCA